MTKFKTQLFFSLLKRIVIILISLSTFISCESQTVDISNSYNYKIFNKEIFNGFPDTTWSRYHDIYNEGWSEKGLIRAKKYYDKIGSAAAILIHNGAVVVAWGDVKEKYWVHSIRKSFLFSMFGIHEYEGNIDLKKTIGELGINDRDSLSEMEKQAKILDLLKSKSGIYHPAANESREMEKLRPARQSHKPGEFWYYNNWDYNVLGVIFEQETRTKIFEEFHRLIATPIQMEDFDVSDGRYTHDPKKTNHPGYPLVMSANDMARFGLLYLNNGKWKDKQIIPQDWIKKATTIYSYGWGNGVGFKWDIKIDGSLKKYGTYKTSGWAGHTIMVIPKLNMVFIHRTNTFDRQNYVTHKEYEKLVNKIIRSYHPLK